MKFRWKIFLLCIGIYIITLSITGVVVIKDTYNNLLNKEIERTIKEQSNVYRNSILYLIVNQKQLEEKVDIKNYSQRIADMFEDENSHIEIFNEEGQMLVPYQSVFEVKRTDEIKSALGGKRNYVLRKIKSNHYIFINQSLEIENKKLVISYIKDITEIDVQKGTQCSLFLQVGFIGFIFIAVITSILSKILIRPIDNLTDATYKITKGNYKDRVDAKNRDEVGILADRFNKMADEIENKITQLEKESEKKQRFIDNLAHELRTPLTSIIGYAELLRKIKYDQEPFNKGLSYIYSEGNRMMKLVNTLMKMIITREDPLCITKQDVMPILMDIAEVMKIKSNEKNIDIQVAGENINIPLDGDMIKAVFINLIDNAIKASEKNSKIIIGVGKNFDGNYLYVRDYGKGMDETEIDKVLEPFYRVDKSRDRREGGVGLGLALSNEIVTRHNAKIKIESKLDQGTTVKIVF